jgi:hypothetical protein
MMISWSADATSGPGITLSHALPPSGRPDARGASLEISCPDPRGHETSHAPAARFHSACLTAAVLGVQFAPLSTGIPIKMKPATKYTSATT